MSNKSRRPLRILVAWRPQPTKGSGSHAPEKDLARTVAWLATSQDVVVRTATVISQTWPQAGNQTASSGTVDPLANTIPGLSNGEQPGAPNPADNTAAQQAFQQWLDAESTACAENARKQLLAAGVPEDSLDPEQASVVISDHSETSRLIEAGQEFGADLMVLGSSADAPKGRYRVGATADALLHCSPIPLLLVPREGKQSKSGPNRVNCAYVDTEQSQQALRNAADLAKRWDVPLRLVAFSPEGTTMYPARVPLTAATGYDDRSEITKAWKEQAVELLKRGRDRALARHPELEVHTKTGIGDSWEDAIDSIKWKKGDLLVLGSSVLGEFNRVFIGPSTNQILRHIPAPMLLSTV